LELNCLSIIVEAEEEAEAAEVAEKKAKTTRVL
jgi:hypothetical protein